MGCIYKNVGIIEKYNQKYRVQYEFNNFIEINYE
jgi:hypothetical protein